MSVQSWLRKRQDSQIIALHILYGNIYEYWIKNTANTDREDLSTSFVTKIAPKTVNNVTKLFNPSLSLTNRSYSTKRHILQNKSLSKFLTTKGDPT